MWLRVVSEVGKEERGAAGQPQHLVMVSIDYKIIQNNFYDQIWRLFQINGVILTL